MPSFLQVGSSALSRSSPCFIEFNPMRNDKHILILIGILALGVFVISMWFMRPKLQPLPPISPTVDTQNTYTPITVPSIPCPNNVCPS